MSATEDPAVTIERLLRKKMRVILDNGALASVEVSAEYPNNDALKLGSGQVTVGLAESTNQMLDLSGRVRQRTSVLRVNAWSTDIPSAAETGKSLRNKIVAEINKVIVENRCNPNVTLYDLAGLSVGSRTCRAFSGEVESTPNGNWTELSSGDYQALWYSDSSSCQISKTDNGSYAVLLLCFKIESRHDTIQRLVATFKGHGSSPAGNGVTAKIWNNTGSDWQNEQTCVSGGEDQTLTITLAVNPADFMDEDGYVWLLARTSHPSDGSAAATLFCDYVNCTATVNGVTYCDVAGSRNIDRVDLKPPIYRTEFTVKTKLINKDGV
jgi:hypothetical protein